ncbi:hypothetical protein [Actinomadura atramentaria]|uniref:hypothetical protein n=1 Tax=Actinomadura atramentaria TaxID=1990 RepID=UPI0003766E72|nr:hypothetical protein [Actinomadura atramentaria]
MGCWYDIELRFAGPPVEDMHAFEKKITRSGIWINARQEGDGVMVLHGSVPARDLEQVLAEHLPPPVVAMTDLGYTPIEEKISPV